MTDEPRGTDWKARLSTAAGPIRSWWNRRSLARLAESTVARMLAGLTVAAGTAGGIASLPDTFDGRDVQATTIERAAADLDAVLDRVAELEAETAVLADASAALLASVREQAAILDGVADTGTVEALRAAVQQQADALARRLSTLAANVADIDLIGAPADSTALDDLAASLTGVADGLAAAAQDAASAAQVADGAAALAETTAADLRDLGATVGTLASDVSALADDLAAEAAARDALAADVDVLTGRADVTEDDVAGLLDDVDAAYARLAAVEARGDATDAELAEAWAAIEALQEQVAEAEANRPRLSADTRTQTVSPQTGGTFNTGAFIDVAVGGTYVAEARVVIRSGTCTVTLSVNGTQRLSGIPVGAGGHVLTSRPFTLDPGRRSVITSLNGADSCVVESAGTALVRIPSEPQATE